MSCGVTLRMYVTPPPFPSRVSRTKFCPFGLFVDCAQMLWSRQTVLCRCLRTAAKTFWLAARRAIGALEVVMVVPKVSPGALRPNRTLFSVSLPTLVGRPR